MKLLVAIAFLGFAFPALAGDTAHSDYTPRVKVAGTLRISGNPHMETLLRRWEEGFRHFHPEARFTETLKGTASGIYGLEMRTADMAMMGRPINPYERYGSYERAWVFPVEIEVATGSEAAPGKSAAYTVFVHRDNPLARLTLKQLDGIFGAERAGGWDALTWDTGAARGKESNIRTWGQLGLQGEWADKPIHVYGPANLGTGTTTFFQTRVMGGGEIFNEDLREYPEADRRMAALAGDRYGIGYAALGDRSAGVKPLALAERDGMAFVLPTRTTVRQRTYPLARPVYIDFTIDDAKTEITASRGDPNVREFLRYVLSKQGQALVAREGTYLPLTPAVVRAQLAKLDFNGIPPERRLLKDDD